MRAIANWTYDSFGIRFVDDETQLAKGCSICWTPYTDAEVVVGDICNMLRRTLSELKQSVTKFKEREDA